MKKSILKKIGGLFLGLAMGLGVITGVNGRNNFSSVSASEGETHNYPQSISQLLNNNATIKGITISDLDYPISKVELKCKYNKSIDPAVTIDLSIGGTPLDSINVGNNFDGTKTWNLSTPLTGNVVFTFSNKCTSGTGKGTFYVTNVCLTEGAAESASPLSSISIDTNPKIEYSVGDEFSYEGIKVTATYEDESTKDITSKLKDDCFTGYNLSQQGTQTVTISYTEGDITKTTTYDITVKPISGWIWITDVDNLSAGDKIVIASNTKSATAGDVSNNVMSEVSTTFSADKKKIPNLPNDTKILTLGGSNGDWTLANSDGTLLGATDVKKLAFGSGTTNWSISIDESGNATIQNGTSSYGKFLHNTGTPRFTTYTSSTSSSMLLPQIYKYYSANPDFTGFSVNNDESDATVIDTIPVSLTYNKGDPTNLSVTYKTSTTEATTVSMSKTSDGLFEGSVSGLSVGSYTFKAVADNYNEISATLVVSKATFGDFKFEGNTLAADTTATKTIKKNTDDNWSSTFSVQAKNSTTILASYRRKTGSGYTTTSGIEDWTASTASQRNTKEMNSVFPSANNVYDLSFKFTLEGTYEFTITAEGYEDILRTVQVTKSLYGVTIATNSPYMLNNGDETAVIISDISATPTNFPSTVTYNWSIVESVSNTSDEDDGSLTVAQILEDGKEHTANPTIKGINVGQFKLAVDAYDGDTVGATATSNIIRINAFKAELSWQNTAGVIYKENLGFELGTSQIVLKKGDGNVDLSLSDVDIEIQISSGNWKRISDDDFTWSQYNPESMTIRAVYVYDGVELDPTGSLKVQNVLPRSVFDNMEVFLEIDDQKVTSVGVGESTLISYSLNVEGWDALSADFTCEKGTITPYDNGIIMYTGSSIGTDTIVYSADGGNSTSIQIEVTEKQSTPLSTINEITNMLFTDSNETVFGTYKTTELDIVTVDKSNNKIFVKDSSVDEAVELSVSNASNYFAGGKIQLEGNVDYSGLNVTSVIKYTKPALTDIVLSATKTTLIQKTSTTSVSTALSVTNSPEGSDLGTLTWFVNDVQDSTLITNNTFTASTSGVYKIKCSSGLVTSNEIEIDVFVLDLADLNASFASGLKTTYYSDETISGLDVSLSGSVKATCPNKTDLTATTTTITSKNYTIDGSSLNTSSKLTAGLEEKNFARELAISSITVTATINGETFTGLSKSFDNVTTDITVYPAAVIVNVTYELTTAPTTTSFKFGDKFSAAGGIITKTTTYKHGYPTKEEQILTTQSEVTFKSTLNGKDITLTNNSPIDNLIGSKRTVQVYYEGQKAGEYTLSISNVGSSANVGWSYKTDPTYVEKNLAPTITETSSYESGLLKTVSDSDSGSSIDFYRTYTCINKSGSSYFLQFHKKEYGAIYNKTISANTVIKTLSIRVTGGNISVFGSQSYNESSDNMTSIEASVSGNISTYDFSSEQYKYFRIERNGSTTTTFEITNLTVKKQTAAGSEVNFNVTPEQQAQTFAEYIQEFTTCNISLQNAKHLLDEYNGLVNTKGTTKVNEIEKTNSAKAIFEGITFSDYSLSSVKTDDGYDYSKGSKNYLATGLEKITEINTIYQKLGGTDTYKDSNGNNLSNSASRIVPFIAVSDFDASIWVISAVTLAGLTAIGGYFFYRKRKENI